MSTPVFSQRFSIFYKNNLFLRSYTDPDTGNPTIINNMPLARALVLEYAKQYGVPTTDFEIRVNNTPEKMSDEAAEYILSLGKDEALTKAKIISGHGLKYRTVIDRFSPKYSPDKREYNGQVNLLDKVRTGERVQTLVNKDTGERITRIIPTFKPSVDNYKGIYFFKSMEHNKGVSLIMHESDNVVHTFTDFETARKIEALDKYPNVPESRHKLINKIATKHTKLRAIIKEIKDTFNVSNKLAFNMLNEYRYAS